jgi:hypothetical protein
MKKLIMMAILATAAVVLALNHDRLLAHGCSMCPMCSAARSNPEGAAASLVDEIKHHCPACKAYEKVHG